MQVNWACSGPLKSGRCFRSSMWNWACCVHVADTVQLCTEIPTLNKISRGGLVSKPEFVLGEWVSDPDIRVFSVNSVFTPRPLRKWQAGFVRWRMSGCLGPGWSRIIYHRSSTRLFTNSPWPNSGNSEGMMAACPVPCYTNYTLPCGSNSSMNVRG